MYCDKCFKNLDREKHAQYCPKVKGKKFNVPEVFDELFKGFKEKTLDKTEKICKD